MTIPQVPDELKEVVAKEDWAKIAASTKVGHRTAIFEYPSVVKQLITEKIFTFDELLEFSWQELQVLCIESNRVIELTSKEFSPEDFHLFDSSQLIEILHHTNSLVVILKSGISIRELACFSGYQLGLILKYPDAISSILKKFETVDDLLKLRWNWVEEMLIRPEPTLSLLEHGVKWERLVNLPDWDFGWFLKHVPEIIKLLDLGIEFETIGTIDSGKLREVEAFQPLIERKDLEGLDFWQMFMILSHGEVFSRLARQNVPQELLFKIDSYNLEIIFKNSGFFLTAKENDRDIFKSLATLKHTKTELLLENREGFLALSELRVGLKDLSPLSDRQFEDVLIYQDRYAPMINISEKLGVSRQSILEIDLDVVDILTVYPQQAEKLIKSGLTFNDLTRYPLILAEVLRHADSIEKLEKSGIPPRELFKLSKDQTVYAFSRFPLLEIMPELGLAISDLEPFLLEEFKIALSNLKSLAILKSGGVSMRQIAEIHLPHFQILLSKPEYTLSLIRKGVPLYRFARVEVEDLKHLLADPLSDKSQRLIKSLLA